jgi:AcrR family transcriptional regulator
LVARYAERTDRDLSPVAWYKVLACYKLGIIPEGTYARALGGQAPMETGRTAPCQRLSPPPASMPHNRKIMKGDGRMELSAAARRLFAEEGIDGPSLREINRAAGQRNTSALQYHFGDRDGLLRAVFEFHQARIDVYRNALLGQPAVDDGAALRELAAAMVLPFVACLTDDDGGPEYLQVAGEVFARPGHFAHILAEVTASSMRRWADAVEGYLPSEALGSAMHRRSAALRFVHSELAIRARERPHGDHRLFASHLTDLVAAILTAPVSDESRRYIRVTSSVEVDRC